MKTITCFFLLLCISFIPVWAQSVDAAYAAAEGAIEAKCFVIIPDSYTALSGGVENLSDPYQFLLCENNLVYLQGSVTGAGSFTHRTEISSYSVKTSKNSVSVRMQVKGTAIVARIDISVRKGSNYADVIVTPTKGAAARSFSGPLVLPSQGQYMKRAGEV